MALGNLIGRQWRPFLHGALVTVVAGAIFSTTRFGASLEELSFDLPTVFNSTLGFPELVLVQMDESSHNHLQQSTGKPWNRHLHADLVKFLHREGARQIVFDVEFYERVDDASSTAALAAAMREHGRVIIGAKLERERKPGFASITIINQPVPELRVPGVTTALSWDVMPDQIVRRHPTGRDPDVSLPWAAAAMANTALANNGARHDDERWVRYYGPSGTLPHVSYWRATNEAPGYYRDKTVFIGGRTTTGFVLQEVDQFRAPWSRWGGSLMSGMELNATAWLNLVRGDWLNRAGRGVEAGVLLAFGVLLGGFVSVSPPRRSAWIGLLSVALIIGAALWLFRAQNLWFDWAVMAFVQVPVALAWRALAAYRDMRREQAWLEAPLANLFPESEKFPASGGARADAGNASAAGAPWVPDYELLSCIGRGGYGEVWLARDVLGGHRAVKIVRRVAFEDDGPYEREFRGLQKFAPVSREHRGLVQVLHVGLNKPGGFFYYVMEAGDDERAAQEIAPASYAPRNLDRDLRRHGLWNAPRTSELGLALAEALEFLHGRGLIHRDIKPANVIFVAGHPKLADVGLVTDLAAPGNRVTQVGTEGFLPPEGPGTASGDVFALGRLLHEALERDGADDEGRAALRRIIERAQEADAARRFQAARELADALRGWRNKYLPRPSPAD